MSARAVLVAAAVLFAAAPAMAAPPKADDGPTFDRSAAATALAAVDLAKCKATNAKRGEGHVTVTFATDGAASNAVVDKGPMIGTPVQRCIEGKYKAVKVPAFKGSPVQVGKSFRFE